MKRLIQKELVNKLSRKILSGEVDKTHPVLADVFDNVVIFRNNGNSGDGSEKEEKSASLNCGYRHETE